MSDALWDSHKADLRDKAEHAFMKATVRYLNEPTDRRRAIVQKTIELFAKMSGNNADTILKEIPKIIERLQGNEEQEWRNFKEAAHRNLFFKWNKHLEDLFTKTAQRRKIGSTQWVI